MVHTVRLGGTAAHIEVANISHGLMRMTATPVSVSDEQAFEAIKCGVDAAGGAKVYLNTGAFYGRHFGPQNLELLARFYEKYPEYKEKTILCVKGGLRLPNNKETPHETLVRESVDFINSKLRGTKQVDVYENARVDTSVSVEYSIGILKKLIQEGKIGHIAMSECSAETLRRANSVYPITHVEIEVSPFCYEEEIRKVIATAAELKIPVLAYGPLGAGFLTGAFRSWEDIPENDMRRHYDHNFKLVTHLMGLAKKKGVTLGQLSIAWVLSLGPHMLPLPGSSHATRTLENLAAGDIVLTQEERDSISQIIDSIGIKGQRYTKGTTGLMV